MGMTKQSVLREAARIIRTEPERWRWTDCASCNCGIIAQVVVNKNRDALIRELWGFDGLWSRLLGTRRATCQVTDLPIGSALRRLREVGFLDLDFVHIENLSDPRIRARAGLDPVSELRRYYCGD